MCFMLWPSSRALVSHSELPSYANAMKEASQLVLYMHAHTHPPFIMGTGGQRQTREAAAAAATRPLFIMSHGRPSQPSGPSEAKTDVHIVVMMAVNGMHACCMCIAREPPPLESGKKFID